VKNSGEELKVPCDVDDLVSAMLSLYLACKRKKLGSKQRNKKLNLL
jgi:hypothetical protein